MKRYVFAVGLWVGLVLPVCAASVPQIVNDGASLWLDASDLPTGAITSWSDVRGAGYDTAEKYSVVTVDPTVVEIAEGPLAGKKAVSFGAPGTASDLQFDRHQIQTAFFVVSMANSQFAFLLGDQSEYPFHRAVVGGNATYSDATYSKDGQYWNDGVSVSSPSTTALPTGFQLITWESAKKRYVTYLTCDRGYNTRIGGRDLCELILFTNKLSHADCVKVEGYLRKKWYGTTKDGAQAFWDHLNGIQVRFDASVASSFHHDIAEDETLVTRWDDLSGNGNHFLPFHPTWGGITGTNGTCGLVNGFFPAFKTGACSSCTDLKLTTRLTTTRTVFMVCDIELNMSAFWLGDQTCYDFHRGNYGTYAYKDSGSGLSSSGEIWKNGEKVSDIHSESPDRPGKTSLYTLRINNKDCTWQYLGCDRNSGKNTGGKQVSELITFDYALPDDDRAELERLLMQKWNRGCGWIGEGAAEWGADNYRRLSGAVEIPSGGASAAGIVISSDATLTGGTLTLTKSGIFVAEGATLTVACPIAGTAARFYGPGRVVYSGSGRVVRSLSLVARWDFNDYDSENPKSANILKATVGGDASPCRYVGAGTAVTADINEMYVVPAGYTGEGDSGNMANAAAGLAAGNCALAIPVSSHVRLPIPESVKDHNWTLQIRFFTPTVGKGKDNNRSLFNLSGNTDDGDLFIRGSDNKLGGGSYFSSYKSVVSDGAWHTISLSQGNYRTEIYLDETTESYANGERAKMSAYLNGGELLLCADNDGRDGLLYIDYVALYDEGGVYEAKLPHYSKTGLTGEWTFPQGADQLTGTVGRDLEKYTRTGSPNFTDVTDGVIIGDTGLRAGQNNGLKCYHGLVKDASYTVVMDVRVPDNAYKSQKWHALFQPIAANNVGCRYYLYIDDTDVKLWVDANTYKGPVGKVGDWMRVAITYAHDGNKTIYVNGADIDSRSDASMAITDDYFYFLTDDNGADYDVDLSYAGIYDRVLTADEIAELHSRPLAQRADGTFIATVMPAGLWEKSGDSLVSVIGSALIPGANGAHVWTRDTAPASATYVFDLTLPYAQTAGGTLVRNTLGNAIGVYGTSSAYDGSLSSSHNPDSMFTSDSGQSEYWGYWTLERLDRTSPHRVAVSIAANGLHHYYVDGRPWAQVMPWKSNTNGKPTATMSFLNGLGADVTSITAYDTCLTSDEIASLGASSFERLGWNGAAWTNSAGAVISSITAGHLLVARDGDALTFAAETAPYALMVSSGTVTISGPCGLTSPIIGSGTLAYDPGAKVESPITVSQFANFAGTLWIKSGRHAYSGAFPSAVTLKVTDGAQFYLTGGTWNNCFEVSGQGWVGGSDDVERSAIRLDGAILGAESSVLFTLIDDKVPTLGAYNGKKGTIWGSLSGCGFEKCGGGEIVLANPKTQAAALTSSIVVDKGNLWIGNGSSCAAGDTVAIGGGIVVNSNGQLCIWPHTRSDESLTEPGSKVYIAADITLNGGTIWFEDGSYILSGDLTVAADSTISFKYNSKGRIIKSLKGGRDVTLTIINNKGSYEGDGLIAVTGGDFTGTIADTNTGRDFGFVSVGTALENATVRFAYHGLLKPSVDAVIGTLDCAKDIVATGGTLTLKGGTVSGGIIGTLNLTIDGSVALTGANIYAGTTTVNKNGKLDLDAVRDVSGRTFAGRGALVFALTDAEIASGEELTLLTASGLTNTVVARDKLGRRYRVTASGNVYKVDQFTPLSSDTFSINVVSANSKRMGTAITAGRTAGVLSVAAENWNQYAFASGTSTFTEVKEQKKNGTSSSANTMTVTLSGNTTWTTGGTTSTGNGELTYGFIDDGPNPSSLSYGAEIKVENVPYSEYSVLVYVGAIDSGKVGPVTINGTVYGADGWGERSHTKESGGSISWVLDDNYLCVRGLTSPTLEVRGSRKDAPSGTRFGLAGIQVLDACVTPKAGLIMSFR